MVVRSPIHPGPPKETLDLALRRAWHSLCAPVSAGKPGISPPGGLVPSGRLGSNAGDLTLGEGEDEKPRSMVNLWMGTSDLTVPGLWFFNVFHGDGNFLERKLDLTVFGFGE